MHGFCLNVNPDLSYFDFIIPCVIKDKGVTSLSHLKKEVIDINQVKSKLVENFELVFNAQINFETN